MKKQKQIAKMLKILCGLLAVMGLVFFGGLTWLFLATDFIPTEDPYHVLLGFSWFIAILCYAVLFQFWKVCNEIGKDNSFSLENARSFHTMSILGMVAGVSYVFRVAYDVIYDKSNLVPIIYALFCIALSVVFVMVCEGLSQLIRNAYEVKLENDLTI